MAITRRLRPAAGVIVGGALDHPVLVAFAVGALARVGAVVLLGPAIGADTVQYREAAESLRRDPLDAVAFPGLPPLFPLLMVLVPGDVPLAIVQALIGGLVGPLAYWTVARHFGRETGAIAGLLAATQPTFIFWSRYLLTDTLGLVCFALLLERASAVAGKDRRNALAAGAAAALSFSARAAYALPALAVGAVLATRGRPRAVVAATFALGAALVLAIPLARNVVALGEPVVYRDQGMLLIWMGTQWTIEGRATAGVDVNYPADHAMWSREERQRYYRDDALATIAARPIEYAARTAGKLLWFWSPIFPEWSVSHKLFTGTYMVALYALAAVGVARRWRTNLGALLVASGIAIQLTVAATIVDYDNRYRVPLEYCLVLFAASGLSSLAHRFRPARLDARHRRAVSAVA